MKKKTVEIKAGETAILKEVEKNREYALGCHADIKERSEIKIMVYDWENSESY